MQPQKECQPQYGKTYFFRIYYAKVGSLRPSTSAGLALQCVSPPGCLQTFSRLQNNVCLALLLLTQTGVVWDHYFSLATVTLFVGAEDQAMVNSFLLQQRPIPGGSLWLQHGLWRMYGEDVSGSKDKVVKIAEENTTMREWQDWERDSSSEKR